MVSPEPPSKTYRSFKKFEKIVFFTDVFSEMKNFPNTEFNEIKMR